MSHYFVLEVVCDTRFVPVGVQAVNLTGSEGLLPMKKTLKGRIVSVFKHYLASSDRSVVFLEADRAVEYAQNFAANFWEPSGIRFPKFGWGVVHVARIVAFGIYIGVQPFMETAIRK